MQMDKEARRIFLLAALLLPLRRCSYSVTSKKVLVTSYIIRDSIKWRVKDIDGVATLHEVLPELARLYHRIKVRSISIEADCMSTPAEAHIFGLSAASCAGPASKVASAMLLLQWCRGASFQCGM